MITVSEAKAILQKNSWIPGTEEVSFEDCIGRVLAEDVLADRDFPPFNRAAMDGIAIAFDDFEKEERRYKIAGQQVAGSPQMTLPEAGTCMEVMTGAVVPSGADTVIRYEDVTIENGWATICLEELKQKANIHHQGVDALEKDVLINEGKVLNVGDLGLITTVGNISVKVKSLPKIAVISTGDELVDPWENPEPHQIRKSNVYVICALLKKLGIDYQKFHLDDDKEAIITELERIEDDFDIILMSGGVSMGKKDFVPSALQEIGVKQLFHKVMQRPGKPLWFGKSDKVVVFGFPGNPVSTLVCFLAHFKPWLQESLTGEILMEEAFLQEEVTFKPGLTYYLPVKLREHEGRREAFPIKSGGSGDLVTLSQVDGFLQLPADREVFSPGEKFPIIRAV